MNKLFVGFVVLIAYLPWTQQAAAGEAKRQRVEHGDQMIGKILLNDQSAIIFNGHMFGPSESVEWVYSSQRHGLVMNGIVAVVSDEPYFEAQAKRNFELFGPIFDHMNFVWVLEGSFVGFQASLVGELAADALEMYTRMRKFLTIDARVIELAASVNFSRRVLDRFIETQKKDQRR